MRWPSLIGVVIGLIAIWPVMRDWLLPGPHESHLALRLRIPVSPAALQILDCSKETLPDRDADDVACLTQFVGSLRRSCRGVRPVVRDQ
jgi:hypothetical protein